MVREGLFAKVRQGKALSCWRVKGHVLESQNHVYLSAKVIGLNIGFADGIKIVHRKYTEAVDT